MRPLLSHRDRIVLGFRCDLIVRSDGNTSHPTALPPEVVHTDSGDEHGACVLGFFRQPCVELRADRGETRPPALGEPRGIERDGEGRIFGEEGEILTGHESLDWAVLRPLRNQIGERPCINAPAEHSLHTGRPSALHQKGREALAGERQRSGGAPGPAPDYDNIKTLHVLPGPAVEKRDG